MTGYSELVTLSGFDRHGTTQVRRHGHRIEIEHGIPGEKARVELIGGRRPRGRILEVLEPSPDRVQPPCSYFLEWFCGGCQWQHISFAGQITRKCEEVEKVLAAGGIGLRIDAIHALEEPWRYRSTAGISLGRRAGFRRKGSLAIVPVRDCLISHPLIGRLLASLNDAIDDGSIPDFRGRIRLDARVSEPISGEAALHVVIRPDREQSPAPPDIDRLVNRLTTEGSIASLVIARPHRPPEVVHGDLFVPTSVHGREVMLAAPSFFQTNLDLLARLIDRIREEAHPLQGKRLADVYSGVGVFGLFLALDAEEAVLIESDSLAVEAARRTATAWGLNNVVFVSGRAEDVLPGEGHFDVAVLDPPRTGLSTPVLEALVSDPPPLILYVSCLAQSLSHDLHKLLAVGYAVEKLELFDFYPQTYHVELLVVLRLKGKAL
jgi:23S rRNA (uracil1939-C5)-methyltransferase